MENKRVIPIIDQSGKRVRIPIGASIDRKTGAITPLFRDGAVEDVQAFLEWMAVGWMNAKRRLEVRNGAVDPS